MSGLIFGVFQLNQFRTQQRNDVASNLTQTFYSKDLAKALVRMQELPDGITLKDMRARGAEYVAAAILVTTSFETMGLQVFKRIAPMELVQDLAGGIIGVMYRKLGQWQEDVRIEQNQPSWGEWFEWLGDKINQRKETTQPAHIKYRNWSP